MNGCALVLDTVTYAMKGEGILKRMGIVCRIVKTTVDGSCKYSLVLSCSEVMRARDILLREGVPVYRMEG